ncbi:unnamed protein product [Spirodela intermedia]|uniref:Uncharacterized protein n=1 Tax=Spirodela intermedia TaxID=51605 RepID=A0A7I8KGP9_SPIIN|nr:unnamed protein product [Spirodela intermedia]
MQSRDEEGEDIFLDSLEFVSTASDSPSAGEASTPEASSNWEVVSSDYEVWIHELRSIRERRSRFLRRMRFDDMVLSELLPSPEIERCRGSPHQIEPDRAMESCSADLDSLCWSGDTEKGCHEGRGEAFLAHELGQKDLLCAKLREIDTGRLVIWEEFELSLGFPGCSQRLQLKQSVTHGEKPDGEMESRKKNLRSWWKGFSAARWHLRDLCKCSAPSQVSRGQKPGRRSKFQERWKGDKQFNSASMRQEFPAHKGSIGTMRFSPDGRYLATGGEDCVVRLWRAVEEEEDDSHLVIRGRYLDSAPSEVPIKNFKLSETPLQELHGHTSDVLDLTWSESNYLLTSSKDKTVRLWHVGHKHCLKVFQHNNYVTCVQFNPIDHGHFISGSIDGKVRIWGISEARVVDWVDIGDIITAVCYRPDGEGFVAGSVTGNCRFYLSGDTLQLDQEVKIRGRKKPAGKSITGFQFCPHDSEKIMISSADGKVRIYDGVEVINKYRGPRRSRSQLSASFTSDGRYIVSVGDDCAVCIWDHSVSGAASSSGDKSRGPCECFFSEAASVAAPWPGRGPRNLSPEPSAWFRDMERFSLGAWFFADFPARVSATWPEEKLSLGRPPPSGGAFCRARNVVSVSADAWSGVIVTAGHDGVIRSFHSYGLPVRL